MWGSSAPDAPNDKLRRAKTVMKDLDGKVFLVTGATEGIGKAAGRAFAERGATLVITARNREKGEELVADWNRATGNGRIELLVADLSKLDDVRAVAAA